MATLFSMTCLPLIAALTRVPATGHNQRASRWAAWSKPGGRRDWRGPAIAVLLSMLVVSGCAGSEMLRASINPPDSQPNSRAFGEPFEPVWSAIEKVFVDWGFRIDRLDVENGTVIGTYFLDEDVQTTTLRLSVTARPESVGTSLSALAVETRHTQESRKRSWFSASSADYSATPGQVIIASETVQQAAFYQRFFDSLGKEIERSRLVTTVRGQ